LHVSAGTVIDVTSLLGFIDNIQDITNLAVYDDKNIEYPLSENVKVYIKNVSNYEYSSISEIIAGDYDCKAYYDKLPKYGGRIRVIIASRKV